MCRWAGRHLGRHALEARVARFVLHRRAPLNRHVGRAAMPVAKQAPELIEDTGAKQLSTAQPGGESTGGKPKNLASGSKQTMLSKVVKPVAPSAKTLIPKQTQQPVSVATSVTAGSKPATAKQKQQSSVGFRKARATPSKDSDFTGREASSSCSDYFKLSCCSKD